MGISYVNGQIKAELKSKDRNTKLKLIIHGWEFPKLTQGEDSKWLFITIQFKNSIYSASIKHEPGIKIDEVKDIYNSLKSLLEKSNGYVRFILEEPYLELSVRIIKEGEFVIKGVISDVDTNSGSLEFEFESNQNCLKAFLVSIKEVVNRYRR